MEARDFGVGHLHCVTRAVVLDLGCCLCLLCELGDISRVLVDPSGNIGMWVGLRGAYIVPSLLDRIHQTVKVGAERL
jgi:hypothetical protein